MIQLSSSKKFGVSLIFLGLAFAATALVSTQDRILGPILGVPLLFFGGCILGKPGRFARSLQPFVNHFVRVEIWDAPLHPPDGDSFLVDSVALLGVGLWVYLRSNVGDSRTKLKIAQPTDLRMRGRHAEIDFAGYVQWASKRIKSPQGKRAPGTIILSYADSVPHGPA
jgi:hypothetical protein